MLVFLCLQVLYNQFKYFFNLYFLILACSQFVDELRLGALYTYWVPLVRSHSSTLAIVIRLVHPNIQNIHNINNIHNVIIVVLDIWLWRKLIKK